MTNEPSAPPPKPPAAETRRFHFTKQNRLLRSSEFRRVYDEGFRVTGQCFAAFCWKQAEPNGPRIGFTVTRATGKANVRNRMKRRVREVIRLRLAEFEPHWWIVFNLRRPALEASTETIRIELDRVIERCKKLR